MEVDVAVVAPGQVENAGDLSVRVAVHVGRSAHHLAAGVERRDQHLVAPRIVEQAFLWKTAELDVDGPGIVALQPL